MPKIFEVKKVATEWDGAWFCEKCWGMHHWKEKAYVDQDNGDKLCEHCAKERILKAAREKQQATYKGNPIHLTADLSAESL